jgi:prepilin-type N-terminal cleavage/methylation domain-containing protein
MSIQTKKNGFSIIELVVVLALMAGISAIALPRWTSLLPNYALNNSIRQVQSELHHIKMRAAAENVSFQLAYLQDAVSYTIQRDATALATKPLADGTTITKEGSISFSPRGTASANRIRLRNLNGSCKQIVVSPTGRVRTCTPANCSADC